MQARLPDAGATNRLGQGLADALVAVDTGALVTLRGEMGAGKTALARATICALGHDGPVVSPTYTLMEPYAVAGRQLCHLDLYRLADPEELEFLGIRELVGSRDWLLVEWPERGEGWLPAPDLEIRLAYADVGRRAQVVATTAVGRGLLKQLRAASKKCIDSDGI